MLNIRNEKMCFWRSRRVQLGCNKAALDSRDVAVGFYEKLGYTADHSRIVQGWTFTCVHMEKPLEQNVL